MDAKSVVQVKANPNIPELHPGDTVKVSVRVVEGDRERIQVFQGVVIGLRGGGISATFKVRRVAYGVGVERTFPLYSPMVQKVEVLRRSNVNRARLYYLRGLAGKAARLKERRVAAGKEAEAVEAVAAIEAAEANLAEVSEAPEAKAPEVPQATATEAPQAKAPENK